MSVANGDTTQNRVLRFGRATLRGIEHRSGVRQKLCADGPDFHFRAIGLALLRRCGCRHLGQCDSPV